MSVFDKSLITTLVCNAVFALVAIPLIYRKVPRNPVYGYRTRVTLGDDALWYRANAYFGARFLVASLLSGGVAVALYGWPGLSPQAYLRATVGLLVAPVAVAWWLTARFVRKNPTGGRGGRTNALVVALALGVLAAPVAAQAQPAGRVARVATLWATSRAVAQPYLDAIEEGLRELGWVGGRNLVIEHRFSDGQPERLPALAAEVVAWKPDIAIGPLDGAAIAMKRLTSTMPIVVIVSFDPVGIGLAASLARPGGNVTGMTGAGPETSAKRLQMLRELAPTIRRVGVVWNAAFPGLRDVRAALDDAAPGLGLTIVEGGVRDPEGFPRAFETLARERVDALVVLGDNLTYLRRREILEAAARHRWPTIHTTREFCDAGGLVC